MIGQKLFQKKHPAHHDQGIRAIVVASRVSTFKSSECMHIALDVVIYQ
jgi:hypothetical protein